MLYLSINCFAFFKTKNDSNPKSTLPSTVQLEIMMWTQRLKNKKFLFSACDNSCSLYYYLY